MRIFLPIVLLLLSSGMNATTIHSPVTSLFDLPLKEFIKLSPRAIGQFGGHKLNLKQRIKLRLLRPSMKKAIRHNQNITVGEFLTLKKEKDVLGGILIAILLAVLFVYLMFLALYKD